MVRRFLSLLAFTLCLELLPAQLDAFVARSTGCHHNGTWYADKSMIPTTEKCLSCLCNKKTLVCRLKVCPEMPMPPPRGCVVVQKKNTCCPYISCARLDAFYRIPTSSRIIAYLDHYERESIDRVVNENVLQRRSDDSEVDLYVCVKNGTVYKSGSAMSSSNLCSYCYCIGGAEKCVKPKCMLPVEGCKPIFVDSTCCPVRYDCSTKTSGKSSQETRYRKTSNKHFLRMSQRLQRNRGCTVGQQFYVEGQKMKSDVDKPCDICFCIRGTRRCAPKKCAPALKNCMPVVPKGQCCPSSYDCGSQRDYRRSHNSRQFNLFSLIFGNEDGKSNETEIAVQYPPDRHPTAVTANGIQSSVTSPKSILDAIREGLEFIDTNNQILADDVDIVALTPTTPSPMNVTTTKTNPTSEISLFDLFLGTTESAGTLPELEDIAAEEKTTTNYEGLSWVDLLLGADEEENKNKIDKFDNTESTTDFPNDLSTTTSIDRLGEDFDDFSGSGEIQVGVEEEQTTTLTNDKNTTDLSKVKTKLTTTTTTQTSLLTRTSPPSNKKITPTTPVKTELSATVIQYKEEAKNPAPTNNQTAILGVNFKIQDTFDKTTPITIEGSQATKQNKTARPRPENYNINKNGLISAFIDGITGIIRSPSNSSNAQQFNATSTKPLPSSALNLPTPKPLPLFKPLPTNKPYTRINSKIANLTLEPHFVTPKNTANVTFKPLPSNIVKLGATTKMTTSTTSTTSKPKKNALKNASTTTTVRTTTTTIATTTTTATSATTTRPMLYVKTNPSILEAEPLDTNTEPSLPPSLPNLKIIPFLPTDAVQADHNDMLYEYYHSISKKKPVQSTGSTIAPPLVVDGHWDMLNMTPNKNAKVGYDLYDDAEGLYPSITEQHQTYPDLEDGSKAEYIYKFNVEGPTSSVSSSSGKMDGTAASAAFVKFDFGSRETQSHGFSPPTKTEGGFVPKESLLNDDISASAAHYQITPHIIDITTSEPAHENTTKVIEITTPDPFKDVIRTEPPPDLSSLIEDKEKVISMQNKSQLKTNVTNLQPNVSEFLKIEHIPYNSSKSPSNVTKNAPAIGISNKTTKIKIFERMPQENKSKIETFLQLLFPDEVTIAPNSLVTTAPTTIAPPFKAMPEVALKNVPTMDINFKQLSSQKTERSPVTTTTTLAPKITTTIKSTRRTTARTKSRPRTTVKTSTSSTSTTTTTTPMTPTTSKPPTTQNYKAIKTRPPQSKLPLNATAIRTSNKRTTTKTPPSIITTVKPALMMSPFDKLPFMDASFEIRHNHSSAQQTTSFSQPQTIDNFLDLVNFKNTLNRIEGLEPQHESTTAKTQFEKATKTTTTTSRPQHATSNSLIDPNGVLKLAGCNIYGRMYRVGRIILELSGPCLECKCTEVGVKCGPLDC